MNQQYKVILKLGPDEASSTGRPTVAECRETIEYMVGELRDALGVRGLGTARVEFLTGLNLEPTIDDGFPEFEASGTAMAMITVDADYFAGLFYVPPADPWIGLLVSGMESACHLREPPTYWRVGDLKPARMASTFEDLLPIEVGDISITGDEDAIFVNRSGACSTFEFYADALEFAGALVVRLEADNECEVYRVGDEFVLIEDLDRYYHLGALDTTEVLQFAADRITR